MLSAEFAHNIISRKAQITDYQESLVDCIPSLFAFLGLGGGLVGFLSAADHFGASVWDPVAPEFSVISMEIASWVTSLEELSTAAALGGGFFGGWRLLALFLLTLLSVPKPAGFHSSPFIAA